MIRIIKGSTRTVIVLKKFAIKVPRSKWELFLHGLLANMQEVSWWKATKHPKLCPVVRHMPGGFLVVMKKAKLLNSKQWENFDYSHFITEKDVIIPVENKKDSFGIIGNQIVAIDYGT